MGLVYYKLEKYQEAIKAYQKAIEIKPDYHKAWNNLGNVYYKIEKYQEAIKPIKKQLKFSQMITKLGIFWDLYTTT